jgi:hypothetical protein
MPTRDVNLTDMSLTTLCCKKLRVDATRTSVKSFALRCGLWKREEKRHDAKLSALQSAINEGYASGIAEGNAFERVRGKLNLPSTPH